MPLAMTFPLTSAGVFTGEKSSGRTLLKTGFLPKNLNLFGNAENQRFPKTCPLLKTKTGKKSSLCLLLKKPIVKKSGSCPLLKKESKEKYFLCLLSLTGTSTFLDWYSWRGCCGDLRCYRSCLNGDLSYFIVDANGDLSYTNLGKAELV